MGGKVIHKELCKKLKFDHTNKWYMHNQESVLKNETYKILRDFTIQTHHLISARHPDLQIVNKQKNLPKSGLCRFGGPQSKNISEKKDKYVDFAREQKKNR